MPFMAKLKGKIPITIQTRNTKIFLAKVVLVEKIKIRVVIETEAILESVAFTAKKRAMFQKIVG